MDRLNEILERLSAIQGELEELREAEQSASEENPLEDGHEERVDALVAEFDTLEEERAPLARREEARQRIRDAAVDPVNRDPGDDRHRSTRTDPWNIEDLRTVNVTADDLRSRAAAAVEADRSHSDDDKHRVVSLIEDKDRNGEIARHVLATGSPQYREAWAKRMMGADDFLTERDRQVLAEGRAQSLTTTQGGFAVPALLDSTVLLTNDGRVNPIRRLARVEQGSSSRFQVITSAGHDSWGYGSEASEAPEDESEIERPEVPAERFHGVIKASIEITQDWSNLASEIARAANDRKDDLEALKFTLGQGTTSSEPLGIVFDLDTINTSSKVGALTTSEFHPGDVYATLEALPSRYQDNASWMASLQIINKVRQFGEEVNHAFTTDFTTGSPSTVLGVRLYQNSKMETAVTTGGDLLVIGDFSRYLIYDRVGMSVEVIPHMLGSNRLPTGERGFYVFGRNGAAIIDANAFRLFEATA